MSDRPALKQSEYCYVYDGSFLGMLSCVFTSFALKEIPLTVCRGYADTLLSVRNIGTDSDRARRVLTGVKEKIGMQAYDNTRACFLAEFPDKEIALIRYLDKGFQIGEAVNSLLSHKDTAPLLNGVRLLYKEKMRFVEFLRFSDYNGKLIAEFEPEHNVLSLIAPHFVSRFPKETFLIYDKTHGLAFVYDDNKGGIFPVDELHLPQLSEEEKKFRALWRMFYKNAAVEERVSERRRMGMMPKKFWTHMTEFLAD